MRACVDNGGDLRIGYEHEKLSDKCAAGRGIPPEELLRIRALFCEDSRPAEPRIGLGLSLARKIAAPKRSRFCWILRQLGHADVATTAQDYARSAGGDAYRLALDLAPGEIPADSIARIEALESLSIPLRRAARDSDRASQSREVM
jgi:hypothetical protein